MRGGRSGGLPSPRAGVGARGAAAAAAPPHARRAPRLRPPRPASRARNPPWWAPAGGRSRAARLTVLRWFGGGATVCRSGGRDWLSCPRRTRRKRPFWPPGGALLVAGCRSWARCAMPTAKRPGLGSVLARPAYRRLFTAQTVSRWGDAFNTVALVVLVFRLTGSGLGVTGAVIAEVAPVLLLAPLAGAVVDRLPRVRVMVAADLWRTALAAALPLVDQHVLAVYAVAFGLAAGGVFFNPAAGSVLPSLVAEDELVAANSGLWSAAVVSQVALAPAAGALVAAVGVAPAFLGNAASFAASALLLAGLRLPGRPVPTAAGSWLGPVGEGFRVLPG